MTGTAPQDERAADVPVRWEDALRELEDTPGVRGFVIVDAASGTARHVRGDVGPGELDDLTQPLGVLARKLGAQGEAEVALAEGSLRVTPIGRGLLLALVHAPDAPRAQIDLSIATLAVVAATTTRSESSARPRKW